LRVGHRFFGNLKFSWIWAYNPTTVECIVPVQQDMPPGRRRHPGDQRHGLGVAAGLAFCQQVRQDGRVVVDDRVGDQARALVADLDFDVGAPSQFLLPADMGNSST
jgi:hypothetical protein